MSRIFTKFFLGACLAFLSQHALADEYLLCDKCSTTQMKNLVIGHAASSGVNGKYFVADPVNGGYAYYNVQVEREFDLNSPRKTTIADLCALDRLML